jgi:ABC-type phosphate transport system substrate-binding protein
MTKDFEVDEKGSSRWRLRMRTVAGLSAVAVAGSLALVAGPAGASLGNVAATPNTGNNLIIGSGSQTTYGVMSALDTLYNESPGCTLVVDFTKGVPVNGVTTPVGQPMDYTCLTQGQATAGGDLVYQAPAPGVTPNPFDDIAVDEPAVGSSNGILQLETGTGDTQALTVKYGSLGGSQDYNVFNGVSFARSSRVNGGGDNAGLNFVAYATDGVDWVHYSTVANAATSSDIPNNLLSSAEIQAIWKGQIYNWSQLNSPYPAPILVFSAQEGSGTQSTWTTSANAMNNTDPSTQATVNCFNVSGMSGVIASQSSITAANCVGPIDVGENETAQMVLGSLPAALVNPNASSPGLNAGASVTGSGSSAVYTITATSKPAACTNWYLGCTTAVGTGGNHIYTFVTPTQSSVLGSSIFFYSSGLFQHQCIAAGKQNTAATCAAGNFVNYSIDPTGHSKFQLGQLGGLASLSSLSGSGPSQTVNAGTCTPINGDAHPCLPTQYSVLTQDFGVWRYVYNVYANSIATKEHPASASTLNYIGETGFLCTPTTAAEIDPATGGNYLSEIQNTIEQAGFYPLSAGASTGTINSTPFDEGSVGHKGYGSFYASSRYAPFLTPASTDPNTADPNGFCKVFSTDANSHPA